MDRPKRPMSADWAKFFNPESLKGNLITASLFLVAYESLRGSVIDQIRGFFTHGFDQSGLIVDDNYQSKVLVRDKSPLRASLLWLQDHNVVTAADVASFDEIRHHRNELAHDLPAFIMTAGREINVGLLGRILELVTKIDKWWILEVEIPTDPDFDGQDVDLGGVCSGRMLLLKALIDIAAGDNPSFYWDAFQKKDG